MQRVALIFVFALSSCSVAGPICAKRAACAADPPGADFQRVCEINYDGQIRALRANREPECFDEADARIALDICLSELDCSDFNEADFGGNCRAEAEDLEEARATSGAECGLLD